VRWKATESLVAEAPIDRAVTQGDFAVVAQIEHDLLAFDCASRRPERRPSVQAGSQLLAVAANGQRVLFDNAGNVVRTDGEGGEISSLPLGADVELVECYGSRSALVLLVAESVGEPLGVPQFSFVVCENGSDPKRLPQTWQRRPAWWFVDSASMRLYVYGEQPSPPLAFDLPSGEPVEIARGFGQRWRRLELTGAALRDDGALLAFTLWNLEQRVGEVRLAPVDEPRNKVAVILSSSDGCPRSPCWAPDGQSIAFRAGAAESPLVVCVELAAQSTCERLTTMQPDGALLWCGARLVVQTSERTLELFERTSTEPS